MKNIRFALLPENLIKMRSLTKGYKKKLVWTEFIQR